MVRVEDLRRKDVVNLYNGSYLGRVSDIEVDTQTATVTEIIIYGRLRWLGLLGREDDIIINWSEIDVIGEDSVLVKYRPSGYRSRRRGLLNGK